jgi:hypothetical protein
MYFRLLVRIFTQLSFPDNGGSLSSNPESPIHGPNSLILVAAQKNATLAAEMKVKVRLYYVWLKVCVGCDILRTITQEIEKLYRAIFSVSM